MAALSRLAPAFFKLVLQPGARFKGKRLSRPEGNFPARFRVPGTPGRPWAPFPGSQTNYRNFFPLPQGGGDGTEKRVHGLVGLPLGQSQPQEAFHEIFTGQEALHFEPILEIGFLFRFGRPGQKGFHGFPRAFTLEKDLINLRHDRDFHPRFPGQVHGGMGSLDPLGHHHHFT